MTGRARAATVDITMDGEHTRVPAGVTVAAAMFNLGEWSPRMSVTGAPRGPLCGMGVCHECRVTIDSIPHQRACLVMVEDGMDVRTADART